MTLKTECKLNSLGALSLGEAGQLSGERNVCPTVHSCSCCSSLSLPAVWVQVDTLVSQPAASLTCPTVYWTPAACSHHARASRVAQSPRSQPGLSACWHVGARLRLHPLRAPEAWAAAPFVSSSVLPLWLQSVIQDGSLRRGGRDQGVTTWWLGYHWHVLLKTESSRVDQVRGGQC